MEPYLKCNKDILFSTVDAVGVGMSDCDLVMRVIAYLLLPLILIFVRVGCLPLCGIVCVYVFVSAALYVCMYLSIHVCMYVCTYIAINGYYIPAMIFVCMYVCMFLSQYLHMYRVHMYLMS